MLKYGIHTLHPHCSTSLSMSLSLLLANVASVCIHFHLIESDERKSFYLSHHARSLVISPHFWCLVNTHWQVSIRNKNSQASGFDSKTTTWCKCDVKKKKSIFFAVFFRYFLLVFLKTFLSFKNWNMKYFAVFFNRHLLVIWNFISFAHIIAMKMFQIIALLLTITNAVYFVCVSFSLYFSVSVANNQQYVWRTLQPIGIASRFSIVCT